MSFPSVPVKGGTTNPAVQCGCQSRRSQHAVRVFLLQIRNSTSCVSVTHFVPAGARGASALLPKPDLRLTFSLADSSVGGLGPLGSVLSVLVSSKSVMNLPVAEGEPSPAQTNVINLVSIYCVSRTFF